MAQPEVVLQPRPPQVEIPVTQPHVLGDVGVIRNRERRRLRLVEDADLAGDNLHFTGRQLRIHRVGRSSPHHSRHADDELGPQPLGGGEQRIVNHDLRDAPAIPQVDEQHAAKIAHPVHPPEQRDLRADIRRPQRAARVGAGQ